MEIPNGIRIKKIDISYLMSILKDLYDRGVNYVDLYGTIGTEQDSVGLLYSKEYIDEKYIDSFEDMEGEPFPTTISIAKLSDEDLNQLI